MKRNMTMWRIIGAIMLITLLVGGLTLTKDKPSQPSQPSQPAQPSQPNESNEPNEPGQHPLIGKEFINFELKTETGEVFDFASGKPMIVMFFASWCPYCDKGIDTYKEFAKTRDDVNITLINAHVFEQSDTDAPDFIKDKKVPFPVLYDLNGEYVEALDIEGVPANLILDADGVVVEAIGGNISMENLEKLFPKED